MTINTPKAAETLASAAQAVVDRWDTPLWKEAEPTAHVINRLREALAAEATGAPTISEALEALMEIEAFPSNQGEVVGRITIKGARTLHRCCTVIRAALITKEPDHG